MAKLNKRGCDIMTANEKFKDLVNNNELTDEQQELAYDYGIIDVNSLYEYLTDALASESFENSGRVIELLNKLLGYGPDDYVLYDDDKISELDYDTVDDVLNSRGL